jgi:hypothetical protein
MAEGTFGVNMGSAPAHGSIPDLQPRSGDSALTDGKTFLNETQLKQLLDLVGSAMKKTPRLKISILSERQVNYTFTLTLNDPKNINFSATKGF